MGSWSHVYFFPSTGRRLQASAVVDCLVADHFVVTEPVRQLIPIDREGHLGEYGAEVFITEPLHLGLQSILSHHTDLFVEFEKQYSGTNALFRMSVSFANSAGNPHFVLAWPRWIVGQLSQSARDEHWITIRNAARAAEAAYVIPVRDAPDDFEDRFLDVDGQRLLDEEIGEHIDRRVDEIWINCDFGGTRPVGLLSPGAIPIGNGFQKYNVGGQHG